MEDKLRLSKEEIQAIKDLALDIFGKDVRLWIFGSRANQSRKGGDIDIYIETHNLENIVEKQIKYLSRLKLKIGDQKIDLIIRPYDCEEIICLEAKNTGVRLI
ncbi:nucleotidyltransferase domain-containing protein [Sulfurihydrogenibium subterraneum]|uniref:nucleotidyltransferase domain-containing protein n=1 Tax=Sulfurihydrogenibium subterraneum TaxID=171121 RepID=UPI0004911FC1|nr:nucleotidyltransferase domain-containing protein [Sulfurihydrogenibium subterraneum]